MNEVKLFEILEKADVGVFKITKEFDKVYFLGSKVFNKIIGNDSKKIMLDDFISYLDTDRYTIKSTLLNGLEKGQGFDLKITISGKNLYMFGSAYLKNNGFYISGGLKESFNIDEMAYIFHEIRTPVNAILSTIHLLNRTNLDDIQRDYLEKTKQSAKTLLLTVNNILDFSKMQSGRIDTEYTKLSVQYLFDEINNLFCGQLLQKNLILKMSIDNTIEKYLIGDYSKLKQILLNLISNSIKFTKEGYIKIEALKQKQDKNKITILFNVEDTGIGLSLDEINKLFEPYSQANPSINRKYGGTGLGLSISKKLVETLGGDIWCDSLSGRGTVFRFTADFFSDNSCEDDVLHSIEDYILPKSLQDKRILLVEDDEINRILTKEILDAGGFKTDVAKSGLEAIALTDCNKYDIIFMDLHMPEMDGITTCKEIRSKKEYIPIIALTANSLGKDKDECMSAGMDAFLTKPVDPFKLYKCIERWLIK